MSSTTDTICGDWRNLLIEVEFAKNYKMPYIIASTGPVANNPVLDYLLPSLLIVKLASLMDEALCEYIAQKGLSMPKTYRPDFNGRICYLGGSGHLKEVEKLHGLRELRNELAHESSVKATWQKLESAIETASTELQHLGFVGPRPKFEISAERMPIEPSDPKYLMSWEYSVTLKSGDKKVAEFTWNKYLHRDEE